MVNSAVDEAGTRRTTIGATEPGDCVRYVREALGDPDLPVEIEDVQRWNARPRSGPSGCGTAGCSWPATRRT